MVISPYAVVAFLLFMSDRASKNLYLKELEGPQPGTLYMETIRPPLKLPGLLYKNVTEPQSVNFSHTPVGHKSAVMESYKLTQIGNDYDISAEWDKKNIDDATRQEGIRKVYYTDKHTLSLFLGIYSKKTIIIHGD